MKDSMTQLAFLILSAAIALGAEPDFSAFDIPGTNFRISIPGGFHPDTTHSGARMDYSAWHFTNSTGSRLSIVIDAHSDRLGIKTNFIGFAALEQRHPMKHVLSLDSRGFTHEELEGAERSATYDLDLIYEAKNDEDALLLDHAIVSFGFKPPERE